MKFLINIMYYFCLYKLRGCKKKNEPTKKKKEENHDKTKNEKRKKEKISKQTKQAKNNPQHIYSGRSGAERLYFPPENSL